MRTFIVERGTLSSAADILNSIGNTAADVQARIAAGTATAEEVQRAINNVLSPGGNAQTLTLPNGAAATVPATVPAAATEDSGTSVPWIPIAGAGAGAFIGHHFGGIIGALVGGVGGYLATDYFIAR